MENCQGLKTMNNFLIENSDVMITWIPNEKSKWVDFKTMALDQYKWNVSEIACHINYHSVPLHLETELILVESNMTRMLSER